MKAVRRGIAPGLRGVVEIPQPGQPRLAPGEPGGQIRPDFLLRAPHTPHPHFVQLAIEEIGRGHQVVRAAEEVIRRAHGREAALEIIRGHLHPVQIEERSSRSRDERDMSPLVAAKAPIDLLAVAKAGGVRHEELQPRPGGGVSIV